MFSCFGRQESLSKSKPPSIRTYTPFPESHTPEQTPPRMKSPPGLSRAEPREMTHRFKELHTDSRGVMKKKSKKFEQIHATDPHFPTKVEEPDCYNTNIIGEQPDFEKCDLAIGQDEPHNVPKNDWNNTISFANLDYESVAPTTRRRKTKKKRTDRNCLTERGFSQQQSAEQMSMKSKIDLENFKRELLRVDPKQQEVDQNMSELEETLAEAENSFYCQSADPVELFSRAVVVSEGPELATKLYRKMKASDKSRDDSKGYSPVLLVVMKCMIQPNFTDLAKRIIGDEHVILNIKGPSGWSPLHEAIFHRNIPLAACLFKNGYAKRQKDLNSMLHRLSDALTHIPDFYTEVEVKVDSFLPLVGSLTPSDTLKITKQGKCLHLAYSLVGYEFPSCKRRDMGIYFDGSRLWGLNRSKQTYCNLLQPLEQAEMVALVQDLLTLGQIKTGGPVYHQACLGKAQSLFNNDITDTIGERDATKYLLALCYTSTVQKRQISSESSLKPDLSRFSYYKIYLQSVERPMIKEKNRNKRVELQLWLTHQFPLSMSELVSVLQPLSMENSLIAEWSGFLKNSLGSRVRETGGFPVKIDIPLSYSLYFNIEFVKFTTTVTQTPPTFEGLKQVSRSEFQNTRQSRQKRSALLKLIT